MLKKVLIIFVLSFLIFACDKSSYNDYKMDASSQASLKKSIDEMSKGLSVDEKIAFDKAIDKAIDVVSESAAQDALKDAIKGKIKMEDLYFGDAGKPYLYKYLSAKINGKTAEHIVKEFK